MIINLGGGTRLCKVMKRNNILHHSLKGQKKFSKSYKYCLLEAIILDEGSVLAFSKQCDFKISYFICENLPA
jgi:hypothetical protein